MDDMEHAHERGFVMDERKRDGAIAFFEDKLKLNGGQFEGKPFKLYPWQAFIIGSLFGWVRADDGLRRFTTAYIETAKGSGKSPLAAGIGLKGLVADGEPRAEIYSAATKQDQAKVLFRDAVAMVEQSPSLLRRLAMSGGEVPDNIYDPIKHSFFRPISSERQGKGQSGPRPHMSVVDEVHEHPTNATVEFLRAGRKWRRQPLLFMITNSGHDRETVCWEYHTYAIEVAGRVVEDDEFFSYVCANDEGDKPLEDESCWPKTNPSLPGLPGLRYLRGEVKGAQGLPSKQNLVRRLNFCEWTEGEELWITRELWESVAKVVDLDELEGLDCYGGLDLSAKFDFTGLSLLFDVRPLERDWDWEAKIWHWSPKDTLAEREKKNGMFPNFTTWLKDGYITPSPGKYVDYDQIAMFIERLLERFNICGIAYDRARIEYMEKALEDCGIDGQVDMYAHGQGFYKAADTGLWQPESIRTLEQFIADGSIRIDVNPVTNWNVSNAVTQQSTVQPEDRFFKKPKKGKHIDGLVSLVQACGLAKAIPRSDPKHPVTEFDDDYRMTA